MPGGRAIWRCVLSPHGLAPKGMTGQQGGFRYGTEGGLRGVQTEPGRPGGRGRWIVGVPLTAVNGRSGVLTVLCCPGGGVRELGGWAEGFHDVWCWGMLWFLILS